jgi:hypothetical protein
MDLIFQFIETANDPRVASILGVGAETLRGMSREDILELIAGDYKVKVTGITGQIMKSEMLQNLVQFMNLLGQNPQAWLPYINEDALLRRLLEAFRPHIHDIEDIVADPATAQAKRLAMLDQEQMNILLRSMPGMFGSIQKHNAANADRGLALQQMEHAKEMQQMQQQADSVQQAKDQQMQQIQMMHAAAMQGVQPGQGAPPQGGGPPPPPYAPPPMANVGQ